MEVSAVMPASIRPEDSNLETGKRGSSGNKCIIINSLLSIVAILISIATLATIIVFFIQWQHERDKIQTQPQREYQELPWFTMQDVDKYDSFLFDIDGTLKTGNGNIPGGTEFITALYQKNKTVLIVSNGDWSSPADKATSLALPGVDASHVVLPVVVMVNTLGSSLKGKKVLALAPDYVLQSLRDAGAIVLPNVFNHTQGETPDYDEIVDTMNENPDMVVVDSWNDYNLEAIDRVVNIVKKPEVQFYILSTDTMWFGKYNLVMADGGSIYEALRLVSGRNATGFGKPSQAMNDYLTSRYKLGRAVFFGDNLNTDIITANGAGMDGCLMVDTGVTNEADWKKYWEQGDTTRKPTYKGDFAKMMGLSS